MSRAEVNAPPFLHTHAALPCTHHAPANDGAMRLQQRAMHPPFCMPCCAPTMLQPTMGMTKFEVLEMNLKGRRR